MASDEELGPGDEEWATAKRRAEVIRALLAQGGGFTERATVQAAITELGIGRTTLYRLIARFRAAEVTSALLPAPRGRPVNALSLDAERERIIADEIEAFYLRAERPRLSGLVERIAARCRQAQLPIPNWRTISRRVRSIDPIRRATKRHDTAALQNIVPVPGEFSAARPLDVVQIDHTPVDVFVVDAETRQGMTRPWLTLAIDVHTRMVVGLHLSLDAPSVISVGLCLLNAVFDKATTLERLGIDAVWPAMGLPRTIHVDNGAEFHSRAFLRGCQEHGIHVDWRPPGTPRYGGHIERLIGTSMGAIHVLAGSTGSSVADRQGRDARERATMTMRELERWLLLEIVGKYHHKVHTGLQRPPIAVWREHVGEAPLQLPPDRLRFWVGFLPEERRQLRRDGIHLFGIRYWAPALAQDLSRGEQRLVVRYDPRDLSTMFVRRSNGHFVEARYRTLGHPPISLWERNAAMRQLNAKGRREVDEAMIFGSVLEQRSVEDNARRLTARARRSRERRPFGHQDKVVEARLDDIDTATAPSGSVEGRSDWDEP